MNYRQLQKEFAVSITGLYDQAEAAAIAEEVLLETSGKSRLARITDRDAVPPEALLQRLEEVRSQLLRGVPMQQALGCAYFKGRRFIVSDQVLIPRPETEELVDWIGKENPGIRNLADLGTGSGCIAISLALALPGAKVTALDVSAGALAVAKQNAAALQANVHFVHADLFSKETLQGPFEVLVSNPPYIPMREKQQMQPRVTEHEPGLALFVPDEDPLRFYRRIGELGKSLLVPGGKIYFECHRDLARDTEQLLQAQGYQTELRKDMHGNDRMLLCRSKQ